MELGLLKQKKYTFSGGKRGEALFRYIPFRSSSGEKVMKNFGSPPPHPPTFPPHTTTNAQKRESLTALFVYCCLCSFSPSLTLKSEHLSSPLLSLSLSSPPIIIPGCHPTLSGLASPRFFVWYPPYCSNSRCLNV